MRLQRIGLTFLALLATTISTLIIPNLPALLTASQVFAQTPDERNVEADLFLPLALPARSSITKHSSLSPYLLDQIEDMFRSMEQDLIIYQVNKDLVSQKELLLTLGVISLIREGHNKAISYYQQALTIAQSLQDRQSEGFALTGLGKAYFFLGNYAKAIEYEQQAQNLAIGVERDSTLGLAYLGLGNYAKAISYLQQNLLAIRRSYYKDPTMEGGALINLGLAFFKSGKLTEAEDSIRNGIKLWESYAESSRKDRYAAHLRRDDFGKLMSDGLIELITFNGLEYAYSTLQQVLLNQNKIADALEAAEQSHARALVDLLEMRLSDKSATLLTLTPPTQSHIQQIAATQNATIVEYSIVNDGIANALSYPLIQWPTPTHESELLIWVVKPTGKVGFRRVNLKPLWQQQNINLAKLVTNSRDELGVESRALIALHHRPGTEHPEQLQQLHKLLIAPIADLLPKDPNAHVVFIPQTSLFLVPFAALKDSSGNYLIEKHTILIAPSIQVLDLTHQQQQHIKTLQATSPHDVLVVGNPTMPTINLGDKGLPTQLPSLPYTEQEAKDIAHLLHTQALTGNEATKATVVRRMSSSRLIHLATHGILNDFSGLGIPGAVALAPSGKDNGLLTAKDILDMKLNAELVVLSACSTGQGRITSDGVIGLSRSFMVAGVPSVIVSLWYVSDEHTAFLMTEFYKNLQYNPDKAQALRSAMLTTMKQHSNPVDWAAFTLIGES